VRLLDVKLDISVVLGLLLRVSIYSLYRREGIRKPTHTSLAYVNKCDHISFCMSACQHVSMS
jgi:hypothetical protein